MEPPLKKAQIQVLSIIDEFNAKYIYYDIYSAEKKRIKRMKYYLSNQEYQTLLIELLSGLNRIKHKSAEKGLYKVEMLLHEFITKAPKRS